MRRKLVAVMLAVMVLSTSLAGCGGSNTDQKESKKTQTTTVDKKSTDMKDESNYAGCKGSQKCKTIAAD